MYDRVRLNRGAVKASGKYSCSRFERSAAGVSFRVAEPRSVPHHSGVDLPSPYPHQTFRPLGTFSVYLPRKSPVVGPSSKMGPR